MKTNYFVHPWTWFKRFLEFVFMTMFSYFMYQQGNGTKYLWIYCLLFGLLAIYIFARPKDDVGLDNQNIYLFKKSIFPFFNRTTEYKISRIKSIRTGGLFSDNTEVFGLLGSGTNRNVIEITFDDNSSKSHSLTIYLNDLKEVVSRVNRQINQNSA